MSNDLRRRELERAAAIDPSAAARLARHLERAQIPQPRMWLILRRPGCKAHLGAHGTQRFRWRDRHLATRGVPGSARMNNIARESSRMGARCGTDIAEATPAWEPMPTDLCGRCDDHHNRARDVEVEIWNHHVAWGQEIGKPYPDRARLAEVRGALGYMEQRLGDAGINRAWLCAGCATRPAHPRFPVPDILQCSGGGCPCDPDPQPVVRKGQVVSMQQDGTIVPADPGALGIVYT